MRVHFKRANGAKVTLDDVDVVAHTVRETRERLATAMASMGTGEDGGGGGGGGDGDATTRLIFKGRVMKDDSTLDAYGLTDESVVHVVVSTKAATVTPERASGVGAVRPAAGGAEARPANPANPRSEGRKNQTFV